MSSSGCSQANLPAQEFCWCNGYLWPREGEPQSLTTCMLKQANWKSHALKMRTRSCPSLEMLLSTGRMCVILGWRWESFLNQAKLCHPFPGSWCPTLCSFWRPPSKMRLEWYCNQKKKFADDRHMILTVINMNRWLSSRFLNTVPLQERGDRRYNICTCKNILPLITTLHCKCKWYVKLGGGMAWYCHSYLVGQ